MTVEIAGSDLEYYPQPTHRKVSGFGRVTHATVAGAAGGAVFLDAGAAIVQRPIKDTTSVTLRARFGGGATPDVRPPYRIRVGFGVVHAHGSGDRDRKPKWQGFLKTVSYTTGAELIVSATAFTRGGDRREVTASPSMLSVAQSSESSRHASVVHVDEWFGDSGLYGTLPVQFEFDNYVRDDVPPLDFTFDPSTGTDPAGRRQALDGLLSVEVTMELNAWATCERATASTRLAVATSIAYIEISSDEKASGLATDSVSDQVAAPAS